MGEKQDENRCHRPRRAATLRSCSSNTYLACRAVPSRAESSRVQPSPAVQCSHHTALASIRPRSDHRISHCTATRMTLLTRVSRFKICNLTSRIGSHLYPTREGISMLNMPLPSPRWRLAVLGFFFERQQNVSFS